MCQMRQAIVAKGTSSSISTASLAPMVSTTKSRTSSRTAFSSQSEW